MLTPNQWTQVIRHARKYHGYQSQRWPQLHKDWLILPILARRRNDLPNADPVIDDAMADAYLRQYVWDFNTQTAINFIHHPGKVARLTNGRTAEVLERAPGARPGTVQTVCIESAYWPVLVDCTHYYLDFDSQWSPVIGVDVAGVVQAFVMPVRANDGDVQKRRHHVR